MCNLFVYKCPEGRELVRILLAAGADPTAQDAQNRTALHIAAMANDVELVKVSGIHSLQLHSYYFLG